LHQSCGRDEHSLLVPSSSDAGLAADGCAATWATASRACEAPADRAAASTWWFPHPQRSASLSPLRSRRGHASWRFLSRKALVRSRRLSRLPLGDRDSAASLPEGRFRASTMTVPRVAATPITGCRLARRSGDLIACGTRAAPIRPFRHCWARVPLSRGQAALCPERGRLLIAIRAAALDSRTPGGQRRALSCSNSQACSASLRPAAPSDDTTISQGSSVSSHTVGCSSQSRRAARPSPFDRRLRVQSG
jgi:hypothetical protein